MNVLYNARVVETSSVLEVQWLNFGEIVLVPVGTAQKVREEMAIEMEQKEVAA